MSVESLGASLLCMTSIVVLFWGLARFASSRESLVDRLGNDPWGEGVVANGQRAQERFTAELDRRLSRRGRSKDLAAELARADMQLTPAEFLIVTMLAVLGAFFIALAIFRVVYVAFPFSLFGYLAPRWYMRWRQLRRQAAFSAQLPDALNLLANSLRSGYSLLQSMELLSKEMQPPLAVEFGRVVREVGLGLTLEAALANLQRRINNDDLDLVVTVILIHHEVGGNLSQILEIINHTVRERIRIKGEIRVLTAQQQMSGYFVGSLPFVLTVVLFVINPSYMGTVFTTLCGQLIFFLALMLVALAFVLIRRIVNIEV